MTYNRKQCAALFLEADYDALILEAYSQSRVTTERRKNGRFPFSCIFCKEIHKDKNMTSYHRMFNLCKVYKEPAALKMYPTWDKSDHAELNRVAKKHGRVFAVNMPPTPSVVQKRKADEVLQPPPSKRCQFPVPPATNTPSEGLCRTSRTRLSPKELHVKFQDSTSREVSEDSGETTEDMDDEQVEEIKVEDDSDNDTVPQSCDVHESSEETTSAERNFRVLRHNPAKPFRTRQDVEDRALVKARMKFPTASAATIPTPPTPVEVSGIYTLITEVKVDWMRYELLDDPQACMEFLHKMVEDGTLGTKLSSAFGKWYLFGNAVRVRVLTLRHSI